jgi:phosphotriesterase-related protein
MVAVPTVRGPVDSAELGPTFMHEHVFVLTADVQRNFPEEWDEQTRVDDAVRKLTELAGLGIRTIVDPTVVGLGRDIPRIQRINEQVDLNIIVATGVYTYDEVPNYYRFRFASAEMGQPEPMIAQFVKDITVGIAGTGVRAGLLKCAVDERGMKDGVARVLRAVAGAHKETGVPIMVHTHPESHRGLEVAELLGAEGVDPRRVQLAHSGDTTDADHLSQLADAGFLLGMDRFGIDTTLPFAPRVEIVAEMIRRGYVDQLVLSHDAACYMDWVDPNVLPFVLPKWHYRHIHEDVLPALREHGVTDEQINRMLVDNPRRYFEG